MRQLAHDAARTPPSEQGPPLEYVDQSLTILGRTFDSRDQWMRQEFLGQREFLAKQLQDREREICPQFKEITERLNTIEKKMDRQSKELRSEMDRQSKELRSEINSQNKELKSMMDIHSDDLDTKMRKRLGQLQNASRNYLRTRGWEEICPIGIMDAQGDIHTPEHFPRTVRRFWSLKDSSKMDQLIYLVRFYRIQGYQEWGYWAESPQEESDSDKLTEGSSRSSGRPVTLEAAVRTNPEIAHRALAGVLGLAYDGIEAFMRRAKQLGQAPARQLSKRRHEEQPSQDRRKRSFKRSPDEELTEVTTPTEPFSPEGTS